MVAKPLNGMEDMTVCLTMGIHILADVIADQRCHRPRDYLCVLCYQLRKS